MLRKSFPPNLCRLCGLDKSKGVDVCSPSARRSGLLLKINKRLSKEGVHIAVGDGLPKFVCSECEVIINDFTDFCKMVHQVQKRLEDEKLSFEEISNKTSAEADIVQHDFKSATKVNHIVCSVSENSATVSVGPDGKVECKLCQNYLEAVEHTTLHMVTHGIGTIISCCRMCGHKAELAQFLRSSNRRDDKSSVWCENCHFQTHKKPKSSKSRKSKQNSQRIHHCDICSKVFASRAHLHRHQIVHSGAKPFLCEVCGTGFSQKSSLKLHVLSHAGLNPHKCDQCGQSFRFKASLRSHVMSLHWPNGGVSTSNESIYRCDHCGKQFATAYKLSRHYRCHTGERPYECDQCGRLFSQSCNLNLHRRKHDKGQCLSDSKRTPPNYNTVINESHLRDPLVGKPADEYDSSLLTQQPNAPTQYVANVLETEVMEDTGDPKFLETILQHPVVPCGNLDVTEAPLSAIDNVLLHTAEKDPDPTSQFVSLTSQYDPTPSHLPSDYLPIGANTGNKTLQEKSPPSLFSHFNHDNLLFIDQTSTLQEAADTVVLPTFSSLQSSASVPMSSLSH